MDSYSRKRVGDHTEPLGLELTIGFGMESTTATITLQHALTGRVKRALSWTWIMNGQLAAVRQGHGVLSGSLFGGPDRTDGNLASFWATYLLWASRLQLWYVKPAEKSKAEENHDAFPGCTQDLDLHQQDLLECRNSICTYWEA